MKYRKRLHPGLGCTTGDGAETAGEKDKREVCVEDKCGSGEEGRGEDGGECE